MSNVTTKCECNTESKELIKIIDKYRNSKGAVIPILHEVQELYGYLPEYAQKKIADELNIPLAEIYGVISFYTQFSLKPKGKNVISICMGTACYVKGADLVLQKLKEDLGIKEGETTEDGLFTLSACRCIGACGLAPVMMINEDVHGRLVPDSVPEILDKYRH